MALWGSSCRGGSRMGAGKAATRDLPGTNRGDTAGGDFGGGGGLRCPREILPASALRCCREGGDG